MNTEKIRYNIAFYLGVLVSVLGIFWLDLWYVTVFGLIMMIAVRWMELDEEEDETERED